MDIEEENQNNEDSDIVENFNFDNSDENSSSEEDEPNSQAISNIIYNKFIYNFDYIYEFFKENNILKKNILCPFCNKEMNIVNNKQYIDNICFRCRSYTNKHDIKISIRHKSFLEDILINLISLYFLIYNCFLKKISANKAVIEHTAFATTMKLDNLSYQHIAKFYKVLRDIIRKKMHKEWKENKLAQEPSVGGVPRCEINESKIIGNSNSVYWMFGIVDRNSKDARVFTVLNNRTKEKLLPLIIENVATNGDIINMSNRSKDYLHKYCLSARIYSDCWQACNKQDFKNNGFLNKLR